MQQLDTHTDNNNDLKHEVFVNDPYEQTPTHCRASGLVSHGYLLLLRLLVVAGGDGLLLDLLGLQEEEEEEEDEHQSAQEQDNIHPHDRR